MKLAQYTRQDPWITWLILPPYMLTINYLLFGSRYFTHLFTFVVATAIALVLGAFSYQFIHTQIAVYIRQRMPHLRLTVQRIVLMLPLHVLANTVFTYCLFRVYEILEFPGYQFDGQRFQWALVAGVLLNVVLTLTNEGAYSFEVWQQKLQETEKLRKANLQSRLESLKQQVNPHFLFNSLNTLSSLIDEDTDRAEQFVEELSSVYRYLLQTNENELTTLSTELDFIQSYFHLLKTRYGSGIDLQILVADRYRDARLPSLSLQMLLENAVKHNVILAEQPLHILIRTDDEGNLVVVNNLQRRPTRVISNQIGLENIATKYALLNQSVVRVEENEESFMVTLPLITDRD